MGRAERQQVETIEISGEWIKLDQDMAKTVKLEPIKAGDEKVVKAAEEAAPKGRGKKKGKKKQLTLSPTVQPPPDPPPVKIEIKPKEKKPKTKIKKTNPYD